MIIMIRNNKKKINNQKMYQKQIKKQTKKQIKNQMMIRKQIKKQTKKQIKNQMMIRKNDFIISNFYKIYLYNNLING